MRRRTVCVFKSSILLLWFYLCLAGCASDGKKWNPDDYTVKSGDTIYSIAWRYELDPEEFAAWNRIGTSRLIKPGQRLHTKKPYNFDADRQAAGSTAEDYDRDLAYAPATTKPAGDSRQWSSNQKWVKVKKGDSLHLISKRTGVSVDTLAQLNQLKKPYTIHPDQTIFLKPLASSGRSAEQTVRKPEAKPVKHKHVWPKTVKWHRPAKGKVIKKFNRRRNDAKGIDIAGKTGDAILASAAGKVVYSGDGLISYGNLIIIKHNKTYLSAYAYNSRLLVKEGEVVKSGQKIAEMGRKDKSSSRLHFEIRKNGKPVDPLKYLPW